MVYRKEKLGGDLTRMASFHWRRWEAFEAKPERAWRRLGADATDHDFLARERWNEIDTRILLKMLTRTAGESVKK